MVGKSAMKKMMVWHWILDWCYYCWHNFNYWVHAIVRPVAIGECHRELAKQKIEILANFCQFYKYSYRNLVLVAYLAKLILMLTGTQIYIYMEQ